MRHKEKVHYGSRLDVQPHVKDEIGVHEMEIPDMKAAERSQRVHAETSPPEAAVEGSLLTRSISLVCNDCDVKNGNKLFLKDHTEDLHTVRFKLEKSHPETDTVERTVTEAVVQAIDWNSVVVPSLVVMLSISLLTCNWICLFSLLVLSDQCLTSSSPVIQSDVSSTSSSNTGLLLVNYRRHSRRQKLGILSSIFENMKAILRNKTYWTWSTKLHKRMETDNTEVNPIYHECREGVSTCPDLLDWQLCGKDFPLQILQVEYPFSS